MSSIPPIIEPNWSRFGWHVEGEYEPPPGYNESEMDVVSVPAAAGRPRGASWWGHILAAVILWNVALYVKQPALTWTLVIFGFVQFAQGAVRMFRLP